MLNGVERYEGNHQLIVLGHCQRIGIIIKIIHIATNHKIIINRKVCLAADCQSAGGNCHRSEEEQQQTDYTTRINVNNIMRKGNVIKPVEVVTVYAEE